MNSDGTNQHELADNAAESCPAWSPDGRKIAFISRQDDEIYIMNANGTEQKRLTDDSGYKEDPVLSPDGTKIAFGSTQNGNWEIYIINIDSTNYQQLTNDIEDDRNPSWSPVPVALP